MTLSRTGSSHLTRLPVSAYESPKPSMEVKRFWSREQAMRRHERRKRRSSNGATATGRCLMVGPLALNARINGFADAEFDARYVVLGVWEI